MPSLPASSRDNAGHRLPKTNGNLAYQQNIITVNAQPGGLLSPLEINLQRAAIPAEFILETRHSKSLSAILYYKNDYSRDRRVKQVTFITIFMRLVVLFFDKYLFMGQARTDKGEKSFY